MMNKRDLCVRTALTLSLAAVGGPALAQDAGTSAQEPAPAQQGGSGEVGAAAQNTEASQGDTEAAPDEIVVTAQKRTQLLIDVPQSISVVGGDTLERQQATNFQDYLKLVPGLQLNQDTPGAGRLVLRGINTGGVASTVAVYVDETPFGSSSGLVNGGVLAGDFDTFDVARIEVLRGPQGTLYGASSLGGVLKFVTNEPSTRGFAGRARASVETVRGGDMSYSGVAMLNVPLGDKLAVRGSGYYRKIGGFVDSIGTAGSDVDKNFNDTRSYGGRGSILFRPSDTFSLRLSAVVQELKSNGSSEVESDPDTLRTLYGRQSRSQFVPSFTDVSYQVYNATANLDLNFATLTSATSYGKLVQDSRGDLTTQLSGALAPAIGPNDLALLQTTSVRRLTQELRLASASNDRFEWLAGGYYTRERGRILQSFSAFQPGTLDPIADLPLLALVEVPSRYEEYAGFANATIYFGDKFDLTFGGRYSYNRQRASQSNDGIFAGGPSTLPTARSSDKVFTYSVAPKFSVSDNVSLYARVAKGFRPGGPNVVPAAAPEAARTFDSDSLVSYEVGVKAQTPDRRLSIDIAAFHIDWKDIQLFALVEDFGVNANGGKASSDGLEFTTTFRPLRGLNLSLNGAYTNARLRDDTGPIVGGADGDRLPFVPEVVLGINGDYEWTLASGVEAYVGGSLRTVSKQSGSYDFDYRTANGRQRQLRAYDVVDLRAGVVFGEFSLEAFARNLTDSAGRTSTSGLLNIPNGAIATGIIRPRTFGVTLGAGF